MRSIKVKGKVYEYSSKAVYVDEKTHSKLKTKSQEFGTTMKDLITNLVSKL